MSIHCLGRRKTECIGKDDARESRSLAWESLVLLDWREWNVCVCQRSSSIYSSTSLIRLFQAFDDTTIICFTICRPASDVGPVSRQLFTRAAGLFGDLFSLTLCDKLRRGSVPERAVGTVVIVIHPPRLDARRGFSPRGDRRDLPALVTQPPVQRRAERVFDWFVWSNEVELDALPLARGSADSRYRRPSRSEMAVRPLPYQAQNPCARVRSARQESGPAHDAGRCVSGAAPASATRPIDRAVERASD